MMLTQETFKKFSALLRMGPPVTARDYQSLWQWTEKQDLAVVDSLGFFVRKVQEQGSSPPSRDGVNLMDELTKVMDKVEDLYRVVPQLLPGSQHEIEKDVLGLLVNKRRRAAALFAQFYEQYIKPHSLGLRYLPHICNYAKLSKDQHEFYEQFLKSLRDCKYVSPHLYDAWADGMCRLLLHGTPYNSSSTKGVHCSLAKAFSVERREKLMLTQGEGVGGHEAFVTSRQYARYHS